MAPNPTNVTPTAAQRGSALLVAIEGTGFGAGNTVSFGDHVTVDIVNVVSETAISCEIDIAGGDITSAIDQTLFSPTPSVATAIAVVHPARFRVGDVIRAGDSDELMLVTEIDGVELTVTRGYESTTPEALADEMPLTIVRSPRTVTVTDPNASESGSLADGFTLLEDGSAGGGGNGHHYLIELMDAVRERLEGDNGVGGLMSLVSGIWTVRVPAPDDGYWTASDLSPDAPHIAMSARVIGTPDAIRTKSREVEVTIAAYVKDLPGVNAWERLGDIAARIEGNWEEKAPAVEPDYGLIRWRPTLTKHEANVIDFPEAGDAIEPFDDDEWLGVGFTLIARVHRRGVDS